VTADTDARRLGTALALIVAYMIAEVVAGILAQSLALLSDAAHMLTDAGALLLSLVVLRLVRRPAASSLIRAAAPRTVGAGQRGDAARLAGLIVYGGIERQRPHPTRTIPSSPSRHRRTSSRHGIRRRTAPRQHRGPFQHLLTDLTRSSRRRSAS
jgi:hypothetical protein